MWSSGPGGVCHDEEGRSACLSGELAFRFSHALSFVRQASGYQRIEIGAIIRGGRDGYDATLRACLEGHLKGQEKGSKQCLLPFFVSGAPGMIRTCDLLIRSQALYPTELRARREEGLYGQVVRMSTILLPENESAERHRATARCGPSRVTRPASGCSQARHPCCRAGSGFVSAPEWSARDG